jgi:hypothetical protein
MKPVMTESALDQVRAIKRGNSECQTIANKERNDVVF